MPRFPARGNGRVPHPVLLINITELSLGNRFSSRRRYPTRSEAAAQQHLAPCRSGRVLDCLHYCCRVLLSVARFMLALAHLGELFLMSRAIFGDAQLNDALKFIGSIAHGANDIGE